MTATSDSKLTRAHRERAAVVYVRQSSPGQVKKHAESTRVQLDLRKRAIALGWHRPVVIDDDLGISAAGYAERPGFQRLLTMVSTKQVGLVLCVDVSRLSRNSKDWAHLLELCGFFDTLVADLDQIYDLGHPNDRLILGIKGTVAELELSILKNRMRAGAEAKAARGELKFIVPPGYDHDRDGRIVVVPDRRVREAVAAMFHRFDRCTSIRQLALWYRDTQTRFPVRRVRKTHTIAWDIPTENTLRKLLQHPIYAGYYTYGRRKTVVDCVDGQLIKRTGHPLPYEQARVCIPDHHQAYISTERYEANLAKIAEARPRWNMRQNRCAVREGLAILQGMLRCGHCGRKVRVSYKATSAQYYCDGEHASGSKRCLSFGSKAIDERVSEQLCQALQPLAIEASLKAYENRRAEHGLALRAAQLDVQACEYEAERAFEQYDLCDPKNRLVADTLEQRVNERLAVLQEARARLDDAQQQDLALTDDQRRTLETLAQDFQTAWNHPKAPVKLRKSILRAAIDEIIVEHNPDRQAIQAVIHWQGGVHTRLVVKKRATPVGSKADESLIELVRLLAETLDDAQIARVLNRKQMTTPRGLRWTKQRARNFRAHHYIRLLGKVDEDKLTGARAAAYLGISRNGLIGLIRAGAVTKHQVTDFAPWSISKTELDSPSVRELVRALQATGRLPQQEPCPEAQTSLFPIVPDRPQDGAS